MKIWLLPVGIIAVFFIAQCTSRTLPNDRFLSSLSLPAPTSTVSLADNDHYSFAIVGDLHIKGDTSRFQRILQAAKAEGDQFVFSLGDIVDGGEEGDYQNYNALIASEGMTGKVFPAVGNHDIFDHGASHYFTYFGPTHYQLEIGNARFVVIDTADATLGGRERTWMEETLREPKKTHTFIISHYMPTVVGIKTYLKLSNLEEATDLMKLASRSQVSAWFGGHYHSFVNGKIDGVYYLTAGGGGGRRMPPVEDFFFVQVVVNGPDLQFNLRPVP